MTSRREGPIVYSDVPAVPDHDDLDGRDQPDQHTIGSITGLRDTLDELRSASPMTPSERRKLDGIEPGAQVNVIEEVKVNGTALTVEDKAVDITIDTALRRDVTALQAEVDGTQETDGLMDRMTAVEGDIDDLEETVATLAGESEMEAALALKADVTSLSDGSVTKVGTATVGSTKKPVYLNAGAPTALSDTVGSSKMPVYLSSGAVASIGDDIEWGSSDDTRYVAVGKTKLQWYRRYTTTSRASFLVDTPQGVRITGESPNSSTESERMAGALTVTFSSNYNASKHEPSDVAIRVLNNQASRIPMSFADYRAYTELDGTTNWVGTLDPTPSAVRRLCFVTASGYSEIIVNPGTTPTAQVVVNGLSIKAVHAYSSDEERSWANGVYFWLPGTVDYMCYVKETLCAPGYAPVANDSLKPSDTRYTDVEYQSMHIPNLTNYDDYTWTAVVS